nr:MAG TPA: hypothetical protein [Caudoviricetes sp.]DAN50368.1 MAG TPA: hypothetical protein [Caudoviricetes sp.]
MYISKNTYIFSIIFRVLNFESTFSNMQVFFKNYPI